MSVFFSRYRMPYLRNKIFLGVRAWYHNYIGARVQHISGVVYAVCIYIIIIIHRLQFCSLTNLNWHNELCHRFCIISLINWNHYYFIFIFLKQEEWTLVRTKISRKERKTLLSNLQNIYVFAWNLIPNRVFDPLPSQNSFNNESMLIFCTQGNIFLPVWISWLCGKVKLIMEN